jgi:nucleoside 2-deoxyribosyltransferase
MNLTVYTIGAISGLSYEECIKQFNKRIEKLKEIGFSVLYPMLGKEHLRNELKLKAEGYENKPISTNHAIVKADFWRVDKADILYVDFSNAVERVSIGSISEISRGYAKDKLIITVMQKENIHRHAFILEMSSIVFETTDEAENYLGQYKELLNKEK